MERIVHKTNSFKAAAEWDIKQQTSLTPHERIHMARIMRNRIYPMPAKDVRECRRKG